MFTTIQQFEQVWLPEAELTQKLLQNLTDESLSLKVAEGRWTLGDIAWHIVTTISWFMDLFALDRDIVKPDAPVPSSAVDIEQTYAGVAQALLEGIKQTWDDDTLRVEDDIDGGKHERRKLLLFLIKHQIHHRGQMTVLMHQIGLPVPPVYG